MNPNYHEVKFLLNQVQDMIARQDPCLLNLFLIQELCKEWMKKREEEPICGAI